MNYLNKAVGVILTIALSVGILCGCGDGYHTSSADNDASGKIRIVTTIFPPADFAKNVGGDFVEINQLLKPGAESHTFEPTPKDILAIQNCDLFIYVGGESDAWLDEILSSVENPNMHTLRMIDAVETLSEEHVDGMQAERGLEDDESEEEEELDEHVWTSVRNAGLITEAVRDELISLDSAHESEYRSNAEGYLAKLSELDKAYHDTLDNAKRHEILVADRFPFRYMAHEYGFTYYAAFPGCSADSEPSARTLSFLINKAVEDDIPVIFHIEFSNEKIADSVVEVCGAKKSLLHSCHNLSKEELDAGEDYISIMQNNLRNLEEALN